MPNDNSAQTGPGYDVLNRVILENKGFKSLKDTQIFFASPERKKAAGQAYGRTSPLGGIEFWPATEKGMPGFPHPSGGGKNALEVYDDKLRNNPALLYKAVWGDLIHGMSNDPAWGEMRKEFKENYTPQELNRIQGKKSWWDDVNGKDANDMAVHDAYIRGWLNDSGREGNRHYGGTMYSPKQIKLLEKMNNYIKTGKLEDVAPNPADMFNEEDYSLDERIRRSEERLNH